MPYTGGNTRARLGGVYTVFQWNNQPIAFAQQVQVQSIQPVVEAQEIHPLNEAYVQEIVTPGAVTHGVLTLTLTELYNRNVWDQFAEITGSNNILEIMQAIAKLTPGNGKSGVTIKKVVSPPVNGLSPYIDTYENCVVVAMDDSETIDVTTMSINKTMTVWFTNNTKNY